MNQPSLLTVATDNTAKLPSNDKQWQAVRDDAAAGSGKYYAYNKDGVKELIGGFGVGNFPFANDTNAAANTIQLSIPNAPVLQDGYIFEARILTSNTGDTSLQINAQGLIQVVNTDGNALVGGELVNNEIYLFSYNATTGKYELLGLSKPAPVTHFATEIVVTGFSPGGEAIFGTIESGGTKANNSTVWTFKDTTGNIVINGGTTLGTIYQVVQANYDGGVSTVTANTAQLDNPTGGNAVFGTLCAKVTSTDGRVAYGYYTVFFKSPS